MTADCNGWNDMPEDEREALDLEDELPLGALDPWEGWPEDFSGPEYWLYRRELEA